MAIDFLTAQPPGMIMQYAGEGVPTGWLWCDGSQVSRTAYSDLYGAIGLLYGSGNGSTTFTLPDARGYHVRSYDDGRGLDSGRTIGSKQGQDFKGFYAINTGTGTYSYNHGEQYMGKNTSSYQGLLFGGGWRAPAASLGTKWDTSEMRPYNYSVMVLIKY